MSLVLFLFLLQPRPTPTPTPNPCYDMNVLYGKLAGEHEALQTKWESAKTTTMVAMGVLGFYALWVTILLATSGKKHHYVVEIIRVKEKA